jgi:hypothetical protein
MDKTPFSLRQYELGTMGIEEEGYVAGLFAALDFHRSLKDCFSCLSGCRKPLWSSQVSIFAFREDQQLSPNRIWNWVQAVA